MKLPVLCNVGIHAFTVAGFTNEKPPKKLLKCSRCGRKAVKP